MLKLSNFRSTRIEPTLGVLGTGQSYFKNDVPRVIVSVDVEDALPINFKTEHNARFIIDGVTVHYRWDREARNWSIALVRLLGRDVDDISGLELKRQWDITVHECPLWVGAFAECHFPDPEDMAVE